MSEQPCPNRIDHDVGRLVADLQHRLETTEDQWRRAAADLDNLRKRFDRELSRGRNAERERVLLEIVALVDDLERAAIVGAESATADPAGLLAGVESIVSRGAESLAKLGYPRFGAVGDRFDPAIHEAAGMVPLSPGHEAEEAVVVAQVVKPGYGSADQLLRPAMVLVAGGGHQ